MPLAQSLPVPQAVTDPAQLQSATVENLQKFSIPALYSTRQIGGSAWSPDASQVAFISNISGRNNLWTIPSTGGWPTQLTISDQRQASPAWSPDGKWIAYMSDKNGNELWDIFLVSPQTGEVTNLTASPDSADEAPAWSPDSRLVAYMTKAKTSPSFEIEIIDIASRLTTQRHPQLSAAARQLLAPLVARRQLARLHPGERQRQGFQHLPLRPRRQVRHQPHAPLRRPDLFRRRLFARRQDSPDDHQQRRQRL